MADLAETKRDETQGDATLGDATQGDATKRPRPTRRRVLTLLGLATVVGTFLTFAAVRHGYFDLRVYHGAINYWVHDDGLLYDYLLPKSTYGFTYPPFAAIVMLPMAFTPWHLAIVLTCIACVAATGVLLYWLFDPIARRQRWVRWYAFGIAFILAAAFEPLRETFLFGQVNMFLVFLVAADLFLLVGRRSRFAGVAIGLATAIKLTPGIFIIYLLVTKRWRAALVAAGTAAAATIVAAALIPDVSRVFWTDALWNTDRVGRLAFISNQSLYGAVARLHPAHPSTILWAVGVALVLVLWFVRVRRAVAAGDEMTGFALTGILGCLMSPVTWVHHLVWVGPALILLLDNALATPDRKRRRQLLAFMIFSYVLLCSRLVWSFHERFYNPIGWFFSNTYVWISIALLAALPIRQRMHANDDDAPGTDAPPIDAADSGSADDGIDRELATTRQS